MPIDIRPTREDIEKRVVSRLAQMKRLTKEYHRKRFFEKNQGDEFAFRESQYAIDSFMEYMKETFLHVFDFLKEEYPTDKYGMPKGPLPALIELNFFADKAGWLKHGEIAYAPIPEEHVEDAKKEYTKWANEIEEFLFESKPNENTIDEVLDILSKDAKTKDLAKKDFAIYCSLQVLRDKLINKLIREALPEKAKTMPSEARKLIVFTSGDAASRLWPDEDYTNWVPNIESQCEDHPLFNENKAQPSDMPKRLEMICAEEYLKKTRPKEFGKQILINGLGKTKEFHYTGKPILMKNIKQKIKEMGYKQEEKYIKIDDQVKIELLAYEESSPIQKIKIVSSPSGKEIDILVTRFNEKKDPKNVEKIIPLANLSFDKKEGKNEA